jgi:hypothetical protein
MDARLRVSNAFNQGAGKKFTEIGSTQGVVISFLQMQFIGPVYADML